MSDERSVGKEVGIRVGDKVLSGLVTLGAIGLGVIFFMTYWKKAPKTKFNPQPEPIPAGGGGFLPIDKPIIPPVIMPPPISPNPPARVSDINLLSGACPLLQYNILQDIEMITPGKIYWGLMPKYVEGKPQRYINSAKRIRVYFRNSLKGAPGAFGCKVTWRDVIAYVEYLAHNPDAKIDCRVAYEAHFVWAEVEKIGEYNR